MEAQLIDFENRLDALIQTRKDAANMPSTRGTLQGVRDRLVAITEAGESLNKEVDDIAASMLRTFDGDKEALKLAMAASYQRKHREYLLALAPEGWKGKR